MTQNDIDALEQMFDSLADAIYKQNEAILLLAKLTDERMDKHRDRQAKLRELFYDLKKNLEGFRNHYANSFKKGSSTSTRLDTSTSISTIYSIVLDDDESVE